MLHVLRSRLCTCAALSALCVWLFACGGPGSGTTTLRNSEPPPGFAGALPFPDERYLSVLATTTRFGAQTTERSDHVFGVGNGVRIEATTTLEYTMYGFVPNNEPTQVVVNASGTDGGEFWIALANFTSQRWEFQGQFTTDQTLPLDDDQLSDLGSVFVAVLVEPVAEVMVDSLQLTANNDPPVAVLQALPPGGPAPLQVEFNADNSTDAEGSLVEYEWEFEAGGGFESTDDTDLNSHIYLLPGTYTATLRVTDRGGATATDSVEIEVTVPTNDPPNAVLSGPGDQPPPFLATFDASGSNDPDGTIEDYRWDIDTDGVFSEAGPEDDADGQDSLDLQIDNPGSFTVTVEVTDNEGGLGGIDTASHTVVATGWKVITIENDDDSGRPNSLALINGKPAIGFACVAGTTTLRYAYSSTDTGSETADWTVVTLLANCLGGSSLSLAEVDGSPALTYYHGDFRVGYTRSATASGSDPLDWTELTPDFTGNNFGTASSLAVVNGNPAIAYQGVNADTYYIRASTANGMTLPEWGVPISVDGSGWNSGTEVSLQVVAGNPAITYRDSETGVQVKYARAANTTGVPAQAWTDAGSTKIVIDTDALFPTLAVINGSPAIAYWDTADDLGYAIASTPTGAAGSWMLVAADPGADSAGATPSLALIGGFPAIAHQATGTDLDLKFTRSTTASGADPADWPDDSSPVDTSGNVGSGCCLLEASGHAAISYYDNSLGDLKYAVLFE